MKTFWISWWTNHDHGPFELHAPWWFSGTRWPGGTCIVDGEEVEVEENSVCAAVRAPNPETAEAIVMASYDTDPGGLDIRFCEERPDDWSPYGDRFAKAKWMPDWAEVLAAGEGTRVGPDKRLVADPAEEMVKNEPFD